MMQIRKKIQYSDMDSYIADIPKFTKKHSLEHTRDFIRRLGNPCHDRKVIHVAGTNGKGSVCAFMQAILLCEGKTVGLFTSPHLVRLNERIVMNGQQISDEKLLLCFEKVKKVVDQMVSEGVEHPSYFEFLYGMGMLAFEESNVEYVILETGLGGRLDATNSFEYPVITIITSVGLDHMGILGNTVAEIAGEKAGIIKEGVPVVFDGSSEEVNQVIQKRARAQGAPCRKIGKDAFEILEITDKQVAFSVSNEYDKNTFWTVRGTGVYQAMNATLALHAAAEVLGRSINEERWKTAITEMYWPGRMEEVLPGVILDGAHNLPAIERFVESLGWQKKEGKRVILFSAVEDKDYEQMIRLICKASDADLYYVTGLVDARGAGKGVMEKIFENYTDKPVRVSESLKEAFSEALQEKGTNGRLYCLGSLYLVGELKELIGGFYA